MCDLKKRGMPECNEIKALKEQITKLSGWLNEHESALAKLRRKTNDAHRKLKIAKAYVAEM